MGIPKWYHSALLVLAWQMTIVGGCGRDDATDVTSDAHTATTTAPSPASPAADGPLTSASPATQPASADRPKDATGSIPNVSAALPATPPVLNNASPDPASAASQTVAYSPTEIPPGNDPPAPPEAVSPPNSLSPCRPETELRPGDWAMLAAQEGRQLRYEIVEVAPDAITTRVEVFLEGRPQGRATLRRDPCASDLIPPPTSNASAERQVTKADCEAAGRRWRCFRYEDRWTDEDVTYVRYTWVSDEAPLFGIVRMELHGDDTREAELELIDWGPKR